MEDDEREHEEDAGQSLELKIFSSFKIYDRSHMDEQFIVYRNEDMDQVHYSGSVPNETIRRNLNITYIHIQVHIWRRVLVSMVSQCSQKSGRVSKSAFTSRDLSNFMYGYEPNPDRHVSSFHILAINSYWEDGTQSLLDLQKGYFDMFYDCRTRINQWFLKGITSLKENIDHHDIT